MTKLYFLMLFQRMSILKDVSLLIYALIQEPTMAKRPPVILCMPLPITLAELV